MKLYSHWRALAVQTSKINPDKNEKEYDNNNNYFKGRGHGKGRGGWQGNRGGGQRRRGGFGRGGIPTTTSAFYMCNSTLHYVANCPYNEHNELSNVSQYGQSSQKEN